MSQELDASRAVATALGVERHLELDLDLTRIGGSALTSNQIDVPKDQPIDPHVDSEHLRPGPQHDLPVGGDGLGRSAWRDRTSSSASTRSTTPAIPIAARSSFARSSSWRALATKAGVEGRPLTIHTPLIALSKAEIIRLGLSLGLDYGLTHSCYDPLPDGRPCGHCDSCRLRAGGFCRSWCNRPANSAARLIPFARSPRSHWPSRSDAKSFSSSSILTILVYLAIGYGARLTYNEHVRQLAAETGTMAATVVVYVNRNLETADAVAATASRHPGMRALDPKAAEEVLLPLLIGRDQLLHNALIADKDGRPVAWARPPDRDGRGAARSGTS